MLLEHNFHLHTTVSFCADKSATVKNYFDKFRKSRIKKVAFTDHFWDCKYAEPYNEWIVQYDFPYLERIKKEIENEGEVPFKVYFGCEVEYDASRGGVILTEETAEKFDFITVPNSHTHHFLTADELADPVKTAEGMYRAYEDILNSSVSRYIDSIAHPFMAIKTPYDRNEIFKFISDERFLCLFDKTAEKGIAVEVNLSVFKNVTEDGTSVMMTNAEEVSETPYAKMIMLAKKAGCKLIFGTDAHGIEEYDKLSAPFAAVHEVLEIKNEDIADIAK